MFRRDNTYSVWDERGLTVRRGRRVFSTSLEEIAVSPRAFTREQILETLELMRKKVRTKKATALSGATRIGNVAYFLVRWEERSGRPWAEALVSVDMASENPKPRFIGRFSGQSIAYKTIDDRLSMLNGRLAVVSRRGNGWGVATYDTALAKFDFRLVGGKLLSYMPLDRKTGVFVEETTYGTRTGGKVDLFTGYRRDLFEDRTNARFIDTAMPWVMVASTKEGARLRNALSGAEVPLPPSAGVRRAGPYVVVWLPYDKPQVAVAYDAERWRPIARWRAGN